MMEDRGIEAKETAVREVGKLLPLPELLASISPIKSDYLSRQQVEQAHTGIDALALLSYAVLDPQFKSPFILIPLPVFRLLDVLTKPHRHSMQILQRNRVMRTSLRSRRPLSPSRHY